LERWMYPGPIQMPVEKIKKVDPTTKRGSMNKLYVYTYIDKYLHIYHHNYMIYLYIFKKKSKQIISSMARI